MLARHEARLTRLLCYALRNYALPYAATRYVITLLVTLLVLVDYRAAAYVSWLSFLTFDRFDEKYSFRSLHLPGFILCYGAAFDDVASWRNFFSCNAWSWQHLKDVLEITHYTTISTLPLCDTFLYNFPTCHISLLSFPSCFLLSTACCVACSVALFSAQLCT